IDLIVFAACWWVLSAAVDFESRPQPVDHSALVGRVPYLRPCNQHPTPTVVSNTHPLLRPGPGARAIATAGNWSGLHRTALPSAKYSISAFLKFSSFIFSIIRLLGVVLG
ncbi:MAG: hypothetical protein HRS57_02905, partial [Mycoplasmataceae bacterium]|nr:hypothetical protein [Mycoplasmataceae bacterium]